MTTRLVLSVVMSALILTLSAGCGSSGPAAWEKVYPTSGKVRFNGQAVGGAIIVLFPKDKSVPSSVRPTATTEIDGSFELGTYGVDDGAPEGEYDVAITWRPLVKGEGGSSPGPNLLPVRYSAPDTSLLKMKVDPDGATPATLELTP
jgi:hypothetical protein